MTQTTHCDAVVTTPKTRIAAVDGLRGVAVLAVMLFHTESRLLPAGFLVLMTAWSRNPRRYIIKYGCMLAPGTGADVDAKSTAIANSLIDEVAATRSNVHTVDPSPLTCDSGRSVDVLDGITLPDDGMHWTPRGGDMLWSLILEQMATDQATRSSATQNPAS